MNQELPDIQAGFSKGKGTIDKIANIIWITVKAREFKKRKKKSNSASLIILKPLTVWIPTTVENS